MTNHTINRRSRAIINDWSCDWSFFNSMQSHRLSYDQSCDHSKNNRSLRLQSQAVENFWWLVCPNIITNNSAITKSYDPVWSGLYQSLIGPRPTRDHQKPHCDQFGPRDTVGELRSTLCATRSGLRHSLMHNKCSSGICLVYDKCSSGICLMYEPLRT